VLLGGALLTAWWYRRHGSRTGIEGRVGPALVAATLFLLAYVVLGLLPFGRLFLWPLWQSDRTALLVIAVGLLALSWQERSRKLAIIAGLFTASAVLATTYNVENIAFQLGWDPFAQHTDQLRFRQLPALVLPAVILLGGALVAAPWSRRVEKGYEGNRPRTWVRITKAGRQAVAAEMAALQALVRRHETATDHPGAALLQP
jgi:hypothetical protein